VLIKICGMTSVDDAVHAADCGADMIGLMFVPSSARRIDLDTAGAIAQAVATRCQAVAVFQDQTIERIVEIVQQLTVSLVQLHGSESPAQIDELAQKLPHCRFIKAMAVTAPDIVEILRRYYQQVEAKHQLMAFLLDAAQGGVSGGTGKTFRWDWLGAAGQADRFAGLPKLMLAGGLGPDNVAQAIKIVRPHGVDVSTGVEERPGKKDPQKVTAFIAAARGH